MTELGIDDGKKARTLSLTTESYQKLRNLLAPKPISEEIDEFIKRRIAELERKEPAQFDLNEYEDLKRKHNKLLGEADAVRKRLKQKRKVYDRLNELADKLGLDFNDVHNAGEVAPKLLKQWDGSPEDAHQYVTLMEITREKWKVEQSLAEVRTKNFASEEEAEESKTAKRGRTKVV